MFDFETLHTEWCMQCVRACVLQHQYLFRIQNSFYLHLICLTVWIFEETISSKWNCFNGILKVPRKTKIEKSTIKEIYRNNPFYICYKNKTNQKTPKTKIDFYLKCQIHFKVYVAIYLPYVKTSDYEHRRHWIFKFF